VTELVSLDRKDFQEWRVEVLLRREGDSYNITRYFGGRTLEEAFEKIYQQQHGETAETTVLAIAGASFKAKVFYQPVGVGKEFAKFLEKKGILEEPATLPVVPPAEPSIISVSPLVTDSPVPVSSELTATEVNAAAEEEAAAKSRLAAIREEIKG